jgi:uncharacterized protein YgbK (DUF1537 family)
MVTASRPFIAFVGDDFTGSTDAMDALQRGGVATMLMVNGERIAQPPPGEGATAVGVATEARTYTPDQMDQALPSVLRGLRATGAAVLHYKVCSTFDSSPTIGSIGRVLDIAQSSIGAKGVPIVVGVPQLGRYCFFGNLFARDGGAGLVYRLDRLPSMRHHPVTPMREADLVKHLNRQTGAVVRLFSALDLSGTAAVVRERFSRYRTQCDAMVVDVFDEASLERVGGLLLSESQQKPLFVIGSSAVEYAVLAAGRRRPPAVPRAAAASMDKLLVVSGSCSPTTAAQIDWALSAGYAEIALDPVSLALGAGEGATAEAVARDCETKLNRSPGVVVHTSKGTKDIRYRSFRHQVEAKGMNVNTASRRLGLGLGAIVWAFLQRRSPVRVVVVGGDTSGAVARSLGIESLSVASLVEPGAPLCRTKSSHPATDGIEISFKGGQIGSVDYFERVRRAGHSGRVRRPQ